MDLILEKYKRCKYQECIELLEQELENDDSLVQNLVKQTCLDVCQCLLVVAEGDTTKISECQFRLHKSFQNIIALGPVNDIVPLQLELTAFFNFIWWTLHYVRFSDFKTCTIGFLSVIQRELRRVFGICSETKNFDDPHVEILFDAKSFGKRFKIKDYHTIYLMSEVLVVILLFMLKTDKRSCIVEQCYESVIIILDDADCLMKGLEAVKEFEGSEFHQELFKFGLLQINGTVSNLGSTVPLDCLFLINSICLFNMGEYASVLAVLKKNLKSSIKPLWYYFGGLASFKVEDFNQSLGFVMKASMLDIDGRLKSSFHILHGRLLSKMRDYKNALKQYEEAISICPNNVAAYYLMGEEFGKIGLNDDMVESLESLVKIKKIQKQQEHHPFANNFESIMLDLLHPENEITESEALYAAAVACGLNERYEESSKIFEEYIEICPFQKVMSESERIIKTPNIVTALHEAATVNILMGNLNRSKRLLMAASNHYSAMQTRINIPKSDVHVTKDISWIRKLLDEELGVTGTAAEADVESVNLYTEEMVYFFEEDVIGLMLSAEIESSQGTEALCTNLGKTISIFSKYLARMQKMETVEEDEKIRWTLVKALSARNCLNIARYQIGQGKSKVEIERTFRRALACNHGDKDVLYSFYMFLKSSGKGDDAQKLWRTFRAKEPSLTIDQCQSLALRHLLRTGTARQEFEKIDSDISSLMNVDFEI